ncbi:PREDICTED: lymphokine-activated killer T-cell-originated protein kinase [Atta cephalotes]|uniref:Protein kinase domain-containing protein n=2 Tax=Atta TaxID=12956 RepID=A0A158P0Y7_ATTCE|nr:PREDICTED: lymphokine-activated killer T-cell-originated protein kinase [Atta cephalotes]XP_018057756.1 PREDICTED: lymphokine-activated killer T-cell-originated protein kinase [Atta colombica]KYM75760.1 Lymphokine-activated killer T-cell-originated protein kinase [Atta colombica]
MAEFSTPPRMRIINKAELNTPIKIPASPLLQKIGYGTGVAVYMFERSSKVGSELSPWAVKKWLKEKSNERNNKNLRLEADVLRQLNHPNIIGFRAFTKGEDGKSCLAMEVLDMSLGDKIEERREIFENEPFPAKNILKVGFEIAKGLEYLHHTAYILHGDIKSWNILVSNDFNTIKLCDFGNSLPLTKSLEIDTSKGDFSYIGTTCWNPPEIISENGPVTSAADIWTYGLVLWEMIALSTPHCEEDFNENESFDNCTTSEDTRNNQLDESDISIDENKYGTRPALPAIDFSEDYNNILEVFFICTTNYKLRPSAKALVNYYKKYADIKKKKL